jgi:hypothetical protein
LGDVVRAWAGSPDLAIVNNGCCMNILDDVVRAWAGSPELEITMRSGFLYPY